MKYKTEAKTATKARPRAAAPIKSGETVDSLEELAESAEAAVVEDSPEVVLSLFGGLDVAAAEVLSPCVLD